ncbi:hypothetical protein [Lysinibacillus sp. NPDC093692]|uniref:hypothetical protein n=1 Tax=Lysinibacillus sp. NPDC093692 TaxID=3390578 RepID=UPI003CFC38CA
MYIYNEHDRTELEALERAVEEMGNYITLVEYSSIRGLLPIRATPALIILREDMQGEHMLEDGSDGKMRITAEMHKAMEEEELNLFQAETHRIDNFVNKEVTSNVDGAVLDIMMRGGTV